MTKSIRRNKDGKQNLVDLRQAVDAEDCVNVRKQGGDWIISRWCDATGCWHEQQCHPRRDERAVLQIALFAEAEHKDCTEYHRSVK